MGAVSTVILDGGMGRELQRRGAPFRQPEWSALALSEAPQAVEAVHAAYIDSGAAVAAQKDVSVNASSEKYVNAATIAGAGGGAAGVAGAVSILAVGSLFDSDAKSGLNSTASGFSPPRLATRQPTRVARISALIRSR